VNRRAATRRFAFAFFASLLAHALVISGTRFDMAAPPEPGPPLEARLAPAPVAQPAVKPRPRRTAAATAARTRVARSPLTLPPEPEPEAAPAAEPAPVAQEPPPPPEKLALAPESTTTIPPANLPRRGQITYTLLYGEGRGPVGRAVQSWEVEGNTYRLASDAETTGIVELFRPQRLRYLSQGNITAQGLRPESFLFSRTRRGQTEAARARFDWSAGSLVYGEAREQKSAVLPAGAQDLISFIYQFALVPPEPGRLRLPITNGSRFETYEIEVLEEERMETPLGILRVLPVKQLPRPGSESVEIWLAAEYRYLPVKVRFFDRDGQLSGEQVVSGIRVSED